MADVPQTEEERDAQSKVRQLRPDMKTEPATIYTPIDWPASEERGPPPGRDWAIRGWLGMGYTTLLSGLGGIGKSILTQQMGTALAIGRDFIAEVEQPRNVLIFAGEDDEDELIRRQIAICQHYGIRLSDLAGRLIIQPLLDKECCLLDIAQGKPMRTSILKDLRDQIGDYKIGTAMLDNIGRLFGGNENDRHHVTSFMSGLAWAGSANKSAMLLIGHIAKLMGSEFSGSTAWENSVRARLFFGDKPPDKKPDEDGEDSTPTDLRYLCKRKVNYTSRDLCTMVYDQGIYNIITAPTSGGLIDSINKEKARSIIMVAMAKLTSMSIIPTDGKTSPNYLPTLMLQYTIAEGKTKTELGAAMRQLIVEGVLKREVIGRYANSTQRFGLVIGDKSGIV